MLKNFPYQQSCREQTFAPFEALPRLIHPNAESSGPRIRNKGAVGLFVIYYNSIDHIAVCATFVQRQPNTCHIVYVT